MLTCILESLWTHCKIKATHNAEMGRRKEALELERVWLRERKATALSLRNGFNILRRGFAKLD